MPEMRTFPRSFMGSSAFRLRHLMMMSRLPSGPPPLCLPPNGKGESTLIGSLYFVVHGNRKLALELHPDKNRNNERDDSAEFRRVAQA